MQRSALFLAGWLVCLHLVNVLLPRLSTRPYTQPVDLLVLALVAAGALYAARYAPARPLLLLYGMIGGCIFVLSYSERQMRAALYMTDLDKWTVIVECCAVTVGMGVFCRFAPDIAHACVLLSRRPPWRCRRCGYDLTGNTTGICPECGRRVADGADGADANTRASCGELSFAEEVDDETRDMIRDMWVNRLAGFRDLDIEQYLRDQTDQTRYTRRRFSVSGKTFRRLSKILFFARRLMRLVRVDLGAELLDAHVTRQGQNFLTQGRLILTIAGRPLRQSRLTMTIECRSERGTWLTAVEEPIDASSSA